MSILETSFQPWVAYQKVYWDPWKQVKIAPFQCERCPQLMIVNKIRIFSQNVRKNSFVLNTILETLNQFDIILIQEPPWSEIRKIPSCSNCEGEPLIGTCHHPNWISYARSLPNSDEYPRVIIFINIRFSSLQFLLRKDIFDHHDICLISFFNNGVLLWYKSTDRLWTRVRVRTLVNY